MKTESVLNVPHSGRQKTAGKSGAILNEIRTAILKFTVLYPWTFDRAQSKSRTVYRIMRKVLNKFPCKIQYIKIADNKRESLLKQKQKQKTGDICLKYDFHQCREVGVPISLSKRKGQTHFSVLCGSLLHNKPVTVPTLRCPLYSWVERDNFGMMT